jgi:hypothetical protein
MFNDVARVDWSEHLPKLTAFAASLVADPPVAKPVPHEVLKVASTFIAPATVDIRSVVFTLRMMPAVAHTTCTSDPATI